MPWTRLLKQVQLFLLEGVDVGAADVAAADDVVEFVPWLVLSDCGWDPGI